MIEIQFTYSAWYFLPFSLIVGLILYVYYFRNSDFKSSSAWILAILRFLGFALLFLLLLKPQWVNTETYAEKPKLLWLEDQSASMSYHSDSLLWDSIRSAWPGKQDLLAEKFDVQTYSFGAGLSRDSALDGRYTNIQAALTEAKERYYGESIGAVVLVTDGIYNQGLNPLDLPMQEMPIYTLAYGNQGLNSDIGISAVRYNSSLALGRILSVELDLTAHQSLGKSFSLDLLNAQGAVLQSKSYVINRQDWFEALIFEIPAKDLGLQRYTLQISGAEEDANPANNQRTIAFEVKKEAFQIALYSPSLNPDVRAIRRALEKDLNYNLVYARSAADLDLEKARLLIAFDWDESLISKIQELKLPSFFMANAQSNLSSLEKLELGIGVEPEAEEQFAVPNASGLFAWPQQMQELWQNWPPIEGLYGSLQKPDWAQVVFKKRIAQLETGEPLAICGEKDGQRLALMLGQGIWRWRIQNYRSQGNTEAFDELFQDWVDYLLSQERRESLEIKFEEKIYAAESSRVLAKLYNPSGELVNSPDLSLVLKGEEGEKYDYRFSREANFYRLRMSGLKPGFYQYEASCELGERQYQKQGRIWVAENTLEKQDLQARRSLLQRLSQSSGGQYFEIQESDSLFTNLLALNSPQVLSERKIKSDLVSKWELFFVALIFLSLEWFLRKYWGSY
jgi:hypothetical protein